MNLNNISFPYPVLGSYDDIMPRPESPKASIVVENGMYVFTIALKYDNKDIRNLINDDFAGHVCEVVCPATRLRKCFKSKDGNFEIRIPKKQLGGKINFSCTVTVKRMILNYKNEGFHADYVGHRFDMEPGDILAVFDQITYNADIKYDKLKAVGSFMVIEETTDPSLWFSPSTSSSLNRAMYLLRFEERKGSVRLSKLLLHFDQIYLVNWHSPFALGAGNMETSSSL